MNKKIKKIFVVILIILVIFLQYKIFAIKATELEPKYTEHSGSFAKFGRATLGYIRNIAAVSSVILIAAFGLKFMVGSVEQKAEYKKHFLPLIAGVTVVLLATTITSAIWNTGSQSLCNHDFGGSKCGSGATCTKCGVTIPSTHSWEHKISGMSGGKSEYDECSVCHATKSA